MQSFKYLKDLQKVYLIKNLIKSPIKLKLAGGQETMLDKVAGLNVI